jgi:hypothetical protein
MRITGAAISRRRGGHARFDFATHVIDHHGHCRARLTPDAGPHAAGNRRTRVLETSGAGIFDTNKYGMSLSNCDDSLFYILCLSRIGVTIGQRNSWTSGVAK